MGKWVKHTCHLRGIWMMNITVWAHYLAGANQDPLIAVKTQRNLSSLLSEIKHNFFAIGTQNLMSLRLKHWTVLVCMPYSAFNIWQISQPMSIYWYHGNKLVQPSFLLCWDKESVERSSFRLQSHTRACFIHTQLTAVSVNIVVSEEAAVSLVLTLRLVKLSRVLLILTASWLAQLRLGPVRSRTWDEEASWHGNK